VAASARTPISVAVTNDPITGQGSNTVPDLVDQLVDRLTVPSAHRPKLA